MDELFMDGREQHNTNSWKFISEEYSRMKIINSYVTCYIIFEIRVYVTNIH